MTTFRLAARSAFFVLLTPTLALFAFLGVLSDVAAAQTSSSLYSVDAAASGARGSGAAKDSASLYSAVKGPKSDATDYDAAERYAGPADFALDRAGEYFYVVEESRKVRRVRVDGSENAELCPLPFKPSKVALFPDETKLAVVGGDENGRLAILEIADSADASKRVPLKLLAEYKVGHSPSDVVVRRDDSGADRVYVLHRYTEDLREIDPATGAVLRAWSVGRDPFALAITDAGKCVVANRITDKKANVSFSCASVRIVDLNEPDPTADGAVKVVELLNGLNLLTDVALSPDGKYAFVAAVQCNYQSITSQVSGGWISENVVLAIDVENAQFVDYFFLDDSQLGAGNPWGVACDDRFLVVSLAGTDELVFLPMERVLTRLAERPEWARPGYGAYTYASFASGEVQLPFRLRVKFGFKGLRQLIFRGADVYALAYFEDAICKATIATNPPFEYYPNSYVSKEKPPKSPAATAADAAKEAENPDEKPVPTDDSADETAAFAELVRASGVDVDDPNATSGVPLRFVELEPRRPMKGVEIARSFARIAPKPVLTARRYGELLFHDATLCFEHWQSCVTCHPDARADGFNWDLLNDGTGNLKNGKSMLLSHETPPSMITGVRADAETAVRAGFTHILFVAASEEQATAVDEYLSDLKPLPSPRLVDGELSESAKRGKILFESDEIGCSVCHPAPLFTDLRTHRVGSQDPNDFFNKFDTPTLIEVWRTAPYLNTGEYLTIRDLLLEGKHGVRDGRLDKKTPQEQEDLIEYVLSL